MINNNPNVGQWTYGKIIVQEKLFAMAKYLIVLKNVQNIMG